MNTEQLRKKVLKAKRDTESKLREYLRVLKIAEKPDREEFEMAAKITGTGILLIGLVGFLFFLTVRLLGVFS